jgi:methionyl-tRNA synthetase
MLLAAGDTDAEGNERVEVLDAGDIPTGTRIGIESQDLSEAGVPGEITIDTFFTIPILVSGHRGCVGGKGLLASAPAGAVPLTTSTIPSGEVH